MNVQHKTITCAHARATFEDHLLSFGSLYEIGAVRLLLDRISSESLRKHLHIATTTPKTSDWTDTAQYGLLDQ